MKTAATTTRQRMRKKAAETPVVADAAFSDDKRSGEGGEEGTGVVECNSNSSVYGNKTLLRGEFHRYGAILYPPFFGLPLYLRALEARQQPDHQNNLPEMALLFNFAVESIMIVSAALHTYPWKSPKWYGIARKLDFTAIFVGIASFYSSLVKLLLGRHPLFSSIETLVWCCAFVGSAAKWLKPDAPMYANASVFLLQGWACTPLVPTLLRMPIRESAGLASGGVFVTLGALAYAFQWPKPVSSFSSTSSSLTSRLTGGGGGGRKGGGNNSIDLFGPHEMFHAGTMLMFFSFYCSMWTTII